MGIRGTNLDTLGILGRHKYQVEGQSGIPLADTLHTNSETPDKLDCLGHIYQDLVVPDSPLVDILGTILDTLGILGRHIFPVVV